MSSGSLYKKKDTIALFLVLEFELYRREKWRYLSESSFFSSNSQNFHHF